MKVRKPKGNSNFVAFRTDDAAAADLAALVDRLEIEQPDAWNTQASAIRLALEEAARKRKIGRFGPKK